jgi:serine/threonine protein kinase
VEWSHVLFLLHIMRTFTFIIIHPWRVRTVLTNFFLFHFLPFLFSIIFRDLKPENVAFDVRGDMRLFDFGLAKELKPKDLEQPPDGFCVTGLTGSRRYMAPEVVQCKNYGLSADVYSYAILFWEVFFSGGKEAFPHMTLDQHFEKVVLKGQRPSIRKSSIKKRNLLSKQLETMMVNMWAGGVTERPTFKSVCEQLGAECVVMNSNSSRSANSQLTDRTGYLMNRSLRSQCQGGGIISRSSNCQLLTVIATNTNLDSSN